MWLASWMELGVNIKKKLKKKTKKNYLSPLRVDNGKKSVALKNILPDVSFLKQSIKQWIA